MPATSLRELLSLPARERAELAMALWDSLSDTQRQADLPLTDEQSAELDRRWAQHLANPDTAVRWDDVLRRLRAGD